MHGTLLVILADLTDVEVLYKVLVTMLHVLDVPNP